MTYLASQCRNPVLPPDIFIPDVEARVFEDRLFVYGSWDSQDHTFCSTEYHVASTADMHEWTIYPKALSGTDIAWTTKSRKDYPAVDINPRRLPPSLKKVCSDMKLPVNLIPRFLLPKNINPGKYLRKQHQILYAPDCIRKDGKYFLYFCTAGYQEGVAVVEQPEGPFRDPIQLPCGGIDPAVFIDDNGKAYYYWGQFRASGVELNEDMCSFDPQKVKTEIVTEEEHGFHEGSSVRKCNGIYYYIYPCTLRNDRPTCLAYATSDHPLGPYTYRGIIIDNAKCDPESWNNHGSIQYFRGQWYVFYHRSSKNSRYRRRLCVEPIAFNEDGTINEVLMTSIGAGTPFSQNEIIEGWRACEVEGGAYIDGTDLIMPKGSCAVFRYIKIETPAANVNVRQNSTGEVLVLLNNESVEQAAPGVY